MSFNYSGIVRCSEYCNSIPQVKIEVFNTMDNLVKTIFSDNLGNWKLDEIQEAGYVTFYKEGYLKKKLNLEKLPEIIRLLEEKLVGYQAKLWFKPGDVVSVFVNSTLPFKARFIDMV